MKNLLTLLFLSTLLNSMAVNNKNGNHTEVISKLEPSVEKLKTKQNLQLAESYYLTINYLKSKIIYDQVKKTKDFPIKHKLALAEKNSYSNAEIAKDKNKLNQDFAHYTAYFTKINTRVQMDRKNSIDAAAKANYKTMPNLEYTVASKTTETKLVKNPFFMSSVNTLYYSSLVTNTRDKKAPKVLTLTCSKMENGERISNVNLPFCLPDFNYVSPYISGNKLYFSSDKPGGYGGYDLYAIELKNDGQWGAPMNLGSQVNSPGNEMYPTVIDSKLFFSSNGHPGFGGMDIFCALPEGINFGSVLNLGNGINSGYDDFSLIQSETNEYFFLSNRDHLKGFDQIFKAGKFGVDFQPENLSSIH